MFYTVNGAIDVCHSLQRIGTMMPSIFAYAYFMARKILFFFPLVPAESSARTTQLKWDISLLNEARVRQVGFLSFLNYYYLITSVNFNKQTTKSMASKSLISSKKSGNITQSSRINRSSSSQQVSHLSFFQLRLIIG